MSAYCTNTTTCFTALLRHSLTITFLTFSQRYTSSRKSEGDLRSNNMATCINTNQVRHPAFLAGKHGHNIADAIRGI